jgi:F-type H+-transporting ATPase subunit b
MLPDWFTIAAQALNFLILVWLMKRYLYKPILDAIDDREKRIAKEIADANAKKAEALQEHDEFQKKNADFEQQRAALLTKATDDANKEGGRLQDEANKAAVALNAKREQAWKEEEDRLHQAAGRRTQQEVFAVARKALADLAGASLEERMVDAFIRRFSGLNVKEKALLEAGGHSVVRTPFDLPAAQRTSIQQALGAASQVQFQTAPELISGIELTANGQKVAWSIADYLTSLENNSAALVGKNGR